LERCEVRIVETTAELDTGGLLPETPKSRAGRRIVAFPAELVPELRWHLDRFAEPGERGLVFVGQKGADLTSGRSGMLPALGQARLICTFMIYGIQAGRSLRLPARASRS